MNDLHSPQSHFAKLLRVMQSVIAAIFGVQSQENMEKDVEQKDPMPYIVVGILVVITIVLVLYFVVLGVLE